MTSERAAKTDRRARASVGRIKSNRRATAGASPRSLARSLACLLACLLAGRGALSTAAALVFL